MSRVSSQYAINNYIHIEGNYHMHRARVMVFQDNKIIYDDELNVHAHIETNDAVVDITWKDKEEENKFYSRYDGKYDTTDIEFDNGKLNIYGISKAGKSICIIVS